MNAALVIGGLAVAGGLGFFFYEKSKNPSPASTSSTTTTTTTAPASASGQDAVTAVVHGTDPGAATTAGIATKHAVTLAVLAQTSNNPNAELVPANYWATQARANGASALELSALATVGL